MATYSRREVVTRRVEFVVPAQPPYGACWTEVAKAMSAARAELIEAGLLNKLAEAKDDQIKVYPADDEIVVSIDIGDVTPSTLRRDPKAFVEEVQARTSPRYDPGDC